MAISVHIQPVNSLYSEGTLARVPISGGAPRELLDDVVSADWTPDGSELAAAQISAEEWSSSARSGNPSTRPAGGSATFESRRTANDRISRPSRRQRRRKRLGRRDRREEQAGSLDGLDLRRRPDLVARRPRSLVHRHSFRGRDEDLRVGPFREGAAHSHDAERRHALGRIAGRACAHDRGRLARPDVRARARAKSRSAISRTSITRSSEVITPDGKMISFDESGRRRRRHRRRVHSSRPMAPGDTPRRRGRAAAFSPDGKWVVSYVSATARR